MFFHSTFTIESYEIILVRMRNLWKGLAAKYDEDEEERESHQAALVQAQVPMAKPKFQFSNHEDWKIFWVGKNGDPACCRDLANAIYDTAKRLRDDGVKRRKGEFGMNQPYIYAATWFHVGPILSRDLHFDNPDLSISFYTLFRRLQSTFSF